MKRVFGVLFAGLLLAPAAAWAQVEVGKVRCTISHFVRNQGAEQRSASIVFNNGDLENPVTIERLTIQDFSGAVAHDSGPMIGIPHPLNTDFSPPVGPLDITVVPPGATYYLRTNHIWDNGPITAGNEAGQAMSVTVQFSKAGERNLFGVHVRPRSRQRIPLPTPPGGFREGVETSANDSLCFRVK